MDPTLDMASSYVSEKGYVCSADLGFVNVRLWKQEELYCSLDQTETCQQKYCFLFSENFRGTFT